MSKKIRTEAVDQLFEAILCLKDKEECYTFFEDVCTINELLSLSQRFEVAKMLRDQKTYLDISVNDPLTLGETVADLWGITGHEPNCYISMKVNRELFVKMIQDHMKKPYVSKN